MQKEHHGIIFGVIAAIINTVVAVFIKFTTDIPDTAVAFSRLFGGFLVSVFWLFQGRVKFSKQGILSHFFRAVLSLVVIYLFIYAIAYQPLVNAITLYSASPLFMPFIVLVLWRILVPKQRMFGSLLGFLGVLLILRPSGSGFANLGSLAALGAGFFAALVYFMTKHMSKKYSSQTIMGQYYIFATLLALIPMLIFWKPIADPLSWLYLFIIAAGGVLYQYCLVKSYTHAAATKVSVLSYLTVVFSGLVGWMIWSELPSIWVYSGSILVILGGVLAVLDKKTGRPFGRKNR